MTTVTDAETAPSETELNVLRAFSKGTTPNRIAATQGVDMHWAIDVVARWANHDRARAREVVGLWRDRASSDAAPAPEPETELPVTEPEVAVPPDQPDPDKVAGRLDELLTTATTRTDEDGVLDLMNGMLTAALKLAERLERLDDEDRVHQRRAAELLASARESLQRWLDALSDDAFDVTVREWGRVAPRRPVPWRLKVEYLEHLPWRRRSA